MRDFQKIINNQSSIINHQRGFSIVEMLLVIGVFMTLIGLTFPSAFSFRSSASQNTTATTLITDLRNQQIKAMVGNTEGESTTGNFGILIEPDRYTLFSGTSFDEDDPANFEIVIDPQSSLSSTFPSDTVVFEQGSGEIAPSFIEGANTITVTEGPNGDTKTITINKYGVVEEIN